MYFSGASMFGCIHPTTYVTSYAQYDPNLRIKGDHVYHGPYVLDRDHPNDQKYIRYVGYKITSCKTITNPYLPSTTVYDGGFFDKDGDVENFYPHATIINYTFDGSVSDYISFTARHKINLDMWALYIPPHCTQSVHATENVTVNVYRDGSLVYSVSSLGSGSFTIKGAVLSLKKNDEVETVFGQLYYGGGKRTWEEISSNVFGNFCYIVGPQYTLWTSTQYLMAPSGTRAAINYKDIEYTKNSSGYARIVSLDSRQDFGVVGESTMTYGTNWIGNFTFLRFVFGNEDTCGRNDVFVVPSYIPYGANPKYLSHKWYRYVFS